MDLECAEQTRTRRQARRVRPDTSGTADSPRWTGRRDVRRESRARPLRAARPPRRARVPFASRVGGCQRQSKRTKLGRPRPGHRGQSSPQPSSSRHRAGASEHLRSRSARRGPQPRCHERHSTPRRPRSDRPHDDRAWTRRRVPATPPAKRRASPRSAAARPNPHRPHAAAPPPGSDCWRPRASARRCGSP